MSWLYVARASASPGWRGGVWRFKAKDHGWRRDGEMLIFFSQPQMATKSNVSGFWFQRERRKRFYAAGGGGSLAVTIQMELYLKHRKGQRVAHSSP